MSVEKLSCVMSDTCTSRFVINVALRDLVPTSKGLVVTLKTGSLLRTFRSDQLLTLSCNTAGDTVDWKASHGRGHCKSTIEWLDLSESELGAEEKLQILDEVKKVLKPAHISLAESISMARGKGVHVLIMWKEPVHEFELQIVDTELRKNDKLSKIADLSLGSVISLGPAVVHSEKSPAFATSPSVMADGEIPPILADARFTS